MIINIEDPSKSAANSNPSPQQKSNVIGWIEPPKSAIKLLNQQKN